MAITLKATVSFPISMVVFSETVKDFAEAREEARKMLADEKVSARLRGETRYRVELLASDKTDEQIFEQIYRQGIREVVRKDLAKEIAGNEARVRTGDVKVSFEAREVPEVELSERWTKTV
ncbi:hypothetical protein PssvBMR2_gp30 [Pseudomonas phage MR2]|uniref:Uncharacterized protein n=1 Tax=Pseudomonas phage MR2 TaxID=2711170 RepID=A0A6M3TA82_9CAUD|nr:hypothetical protein PssvBMR2_gp30 [Pseudomonas phage MR2]